MHHLRGAERATNFFCWGCWGPLGREQKMRGVLSTGGRIAFAALQVVTMAGRAFVCVVGVCVALLAVVNAGTTPEGLAFLAKNKEREGVVELPSGLQVRVVVLLRCACPCLTLLPYL